MKMPKVLLIVAPCYFLLRAPFCLAAPPNHLTGQSSAYLVAAEHQLVDWYSFGPEAFRRAKELRRPILLDVGAIWCPWCKRMDLESYNVPKTAQYINDHFVAVKVDYDTAGPLVAQLERAQAYLNLPSGLPLISFLTYDGRLFDGNGYLLALATEAKPSLRSVMQEALLHASNPTYLEENSYKIPIRGIEK